MSCRDEAFSTTLHFENFNSNEEINNRMDELTYYESDEYKSYNSDDVREGRMERSSSLGEGRNEKGNEDRNKERNEQGNERGDSHILAKR